MKDKDIHNFCVHHKYIKDELMNFLNGTLSEKEQQWFQYFEKDRCNNVKIVTEDNNLLIVIPEEEKIKVLRSTFYNPKHFKKSPQAMHTFLKEF